VKFRKTYYYDRTDYTYTDRNGQKITLRIGDKSPLDGKPVTAELIKQLHAFDDAEVYNNLKNCRTAPGNWNISLDIFFGEDDGSDIDRSDIMAQICTHNNNPDEERLWEIVEELPPKTRIACQLVWHEGYSVTEAADILNCSKANVSKLLTRAEKAVREKF